MILPPPRPPRKKRSDGSRAVCAARVAALRAKSCAAQFLKRGLALGVELSVSQINFVVAALERLKADRAFPARVRPACSTADDKVVVVVRLDGVLVVASSAVSLRPVERVPVAYRPATGGA
jgi:hypothetical protein